MISKFINPILLILVVFWITSCTAANKAVQPTNQEKSWDNTDQIIFMNYSIRRNIAGEYEIELINKIVAGGKIKINSIQTSTPKEGDIKCLTLDENKRPVSSLIIPDPLSKRIEYQQDNGSLTSKEVFLDRTEFSVRMQLDKGSRFIAIERINPSDSTFLLLTEIE